MTQNLLQSETKIKYSDLIRDGGSAAIGLVNGEERIHIRIMRSRMEQQSKNYNHVEISDGQDVLDVVQYIDDIPGLLEFLRENKICIKPAVWNIFNAASRSPL